MTAKDAAQAMAGEAPGTLPGPISTATNDGFYNDKVVLQFSVATVVWGIVGMAVGVLIAAQLYWPTIGEGIPWLNYGRLRPLHTNAVIFAFGGCALMATSFHVVQRTCHGRTLAQRAIDTVGILRP